MVAVTWAAALAAATWVASAAATWAASAEPNRRLGAARVGGFGGGHIGGFRAGHVARRRPRALGRHRFVGGYDGYGLDCPYDPTYTYTCAVQLHLLSVRLSPGNRQHAASPASWAAQKNGVVGWRAGPLPDGQSRPAEAPYDRTQLRPEFEFNVPKPQFSGSPACPPYHLSDRRDFHRPKIQL